MPIAPYDQMGTPFAGWIASRYPVPGGVVGIAAGASSLPQEAFEDLRSEAFFGPNGFTSDTWRLIQGWNTSAVCRGLARYLFGTKRGNGVAWGAWR